MKELQRKLKEAGKKIRSINAYKHILLSYVDVYFGTQLERDDKFFEDILDGIESSINVLYENMKFFNTSFEGSSDIVENLRILISVIKQTNHRGLYKVLLDMVQLLCLYIDFEQKELLHLFRKKQ